MASNLVFVGCCVMLVALINPAFSLECFQCQAELGQNITCETNVWASQSNGNCSLGNVCAKYVFKLGNTTTLYRTCSPENFCEVQRAASEGKINQENGNQAGGANLTLVSCRTCRDPLCNSVTLPTINFGILGSMVLSLVAFYRV